MSVCIILESSPNGGQRRNSDSTRRVADFRPTIFCAKPWTALKKQNHSAHPVTTMPFYGGIPALASLNGTNSWLAKKKNESNFLWNKIAGQPLQLPRTLAGESACSTSATEAPRFTNGSARCGIAQDVGETRSAS